MSGWHYHPLAASLSYGVIAKDGQRPSAARFLTPEAAKKAAENRQVAA